ncbi:hypothetical protein HPB47_016362 [Ixodes persulcatus]|uniref:Uncharacterized protein n=1 Tax=Ixodes persulcatus TaxID=34615 RepID=A0AC60R121_IXOPE|nr:hypothetical protein HPB47_016362 [Ixodes persulcatus]
MRTERIPNTPLGDEAISPAISVPQWGPWGPWSDCSKTCAMGLRLRSRQCLLEGTNGTQAVSPQACGPGSGRQREFCDTRTPCPIDGGWGPWSELICSRTCDSGLGKRTRTCNNPSPQFGGAECQGSEWDMAKCQGEPCPSVLQTAWTPFSRPDIAAAL